MRIIAGEFRSRRLKTRPGMATRPTPDRLRQALFDILAPRIAGSVFVDAYAGTGAVGIEALSRGAARAILIERSRAAVELIRGNLAVLGLTSRAEVLTGKAANVLERVEADLVFLDPPYEVPAEYDRALAALSGKPGLLAAVQHAPKLALKERYGGLHRTRTVVHGSNALSFYES